MSWLPKAMARGSQELGMIDVALGWRGWKAEGSWMRALLELEICCEKVPYVSGLIFNVLFFQIFFNILYMVH